MTRVPASGWHLQITHPDTNRTFALDVLEDPQETPSLNRLPTFDIPVPKSADRFELDGASVDLWRDGRPQPVDSIEDVRSEPGRTVLVCEGGEELKTRVSEEWDVKRTHLAARDLVDNNTPYATDVDAPMALMQTDQLVADPSGETELENALPSQSLPSGEPLEVAGGGIQPTQTCWVAETENYDANNGRSTDSTFGDASNGAAEEWRGDTREAFYQFSTDHPIPADTLRCVHRVAESADDAAIVEVHIDNSHTTNTGDFSDTGVSFGVGPISDAQWDPAAPNDGRSMTHGEITGEFTIMLKDSELAPEFNFIDLFAVWDPNYSDLDVSTFDNTLTNNYLDDPPLYPTSINLAFADETTPFLYVAGDLSITMDDTSNGQAIALSNDFGQNYPISGSNTSSVSGDFPNDGSAIHPRITFSNHSPNGAQSATPRFGYAPQTLTAYELRADIDEAPRLVNETVDDRLHRVLTKLAGENFVWSYRVDADGNGELAWTQPGQRTASIDPPINAAQTSITKEGAIVEKVTIKGSNRRVPGEDFTASTSFVDLNQDNLITGSEAVEDPSTGTTFTLNTDYEMDYTNGQIRIVDRGGMTQGDTYSISYQFETSATHTASGAGADPAEIVREIPGAPNEDVCFQLAYYAVQRLKVPRWAGQVTLREVPPTFDPLEALPLASMDLPDSATPIAPIDNPEGDVIGVTLRVGTRRETDVIFSSLENRVESVATRV